MRIQITTLKLSPVLGSRIAGLVPEWVCSHSTSSLPPHAFTKSCCRSLAGSSWCEIPARRSGSYLAARDVSKQLLVLSLPAFVGSAKDTPLVVTFRITLSLFRNVTA